jgi:hypothetical protein
MLNQTIRNSHLTFGCADVTYNATTNERGYLGGLNCCGDETHCVIKEDFNAPERTLYMKVSCFAHLLLCFTDCFLKPSNYCFSCFKLDMAEI